MNNEQNTSVVGYLSYFLYGSLLVLLMLFTLPSCTQNWTEAREQKFIEKCSEEVIQKGRTNADDYCHCVLEKIKKHYPDIRYVNNITDEEVQTFNQECSVLLSLNSEQ